MEKNNLFQWKPVKFCKTSSTLHNAVNISKISLHNLEPCHWNINSILDFVMFLNNLLKWCVANLANPTI